MSQPLATRVSDTQARRCRRLPFHIAAVLLFLCSVAAHYDGATGFTRYICFGDRFASTRLSEVTDAHPFVHAGTTCYDGQFYAQIAVSPLLADAGLRAALDNPAYRARRIGLPWFAWLAGVGHAPWILQAYALANVFAWLVLAVLLLHWIPPGSATALLAWLGCLFGVGAMMSVERALTDLPAALCVGVAIYLIERARRLGAGAAFALAVLTRDTSVLAGSLLLPGNAGSVAAWLRAALVGAAALVPFAMWSLYVSARFQGVPSVDASNFAWPFVAMLGALDAAWRDTSDAGSAAFVLHLLCVVGLCTQFLFLAGLARSGWRTPWWRVGAAFALLFAVLGPAVWQDYPAAARAVIPMTLAFNILLPRDRWWSFPVCVLGNLPLLRGLHYLLAPIWNHLM